MINRRELLKGSAAVAALVSFPAAGILAEVPSGRSLITIDMMIREFVRLMVFDDRLSFSDKAIVGGKLGDNVLYRKYGNTIINKHDAIDVQVTIKHLGLSMDEFSDRYIGPMAEVMSLGLSKEAQGKDIICMQLGTQDKSMQRVATYKGVSARVNMMYDIRTDAIFCAFDMIYGTAKRI